MNLELMKAGAAGAISVTANVDPLRMARFCQAFLDGDVDEAARIDAELQPLHRVLFLESNPIPVKWALQEMGRIPEGIRLPLTPLSESFHAPVRQALEQLGLAAGSHAGTDRTSA
jgi:4-hydroxy-tetrahydrodipicolinate synthase